VLDEAGDFEKLCNLSMVELEPIPAEDEALEVTAHQGGDMEAHGLVEIMTDMTKDDARRLKRLIQNHKHYTGSQRAKHILDNWQSYRSRFIKVMPVDYRSALKKIQQAQAVTAKQEGI